MLNYRKPISALLVISAAFWASSLIISSCSKQSENQRTKPQPSRQEVAGLIKEQVDKNYVGSETCGSCHEEAYQDWKDSHHHHAMEVADDNSIRGNFENVTFENQGVKYHFFVKDDGYYVNTAGESDDYQDFRVLYTFGYEPLQQYIVGFPDGRYQCLRVAWDTKENKWFDLYPDMQLYENEWIHWTNGGLRWNTMCADCHSTKVKKNLDPSDISYKTSFNQIDAGCESCHGPGKRHIEWIKSEKKEKIEGSYLHLTSNLTSEEQVDQCARCHSLRTQFTNTFDHEESFMDHYAPDLLRDGVYHPDGQILSEVYVYGSFIQSKMYQNGVKCTDCHNPHTLKLKKSGNQLCVNCHNPKKYDDLLHHRHWQGSEGAQCISCHMPGRYYMVNDYRRDHSFRIPRPDLSVKFGTPNACNDCHKDKKPEWAAKAVVDWFGPNRPSHFSETLVNAHQNLMQSIPDLIKLTHNKKQPSIARATAVWYLSIGATPEAIEAIVDMFDDEDPILRYTSIVHSQNLINPTEKIKKLTPLLGDKKRSIRVATAESMMGIAEGHFNSNDLDNFRKASSEFLKSLAVKSDFPGAQMQKAQYYQRMGDKAKVEQAYMKALEMDDRFNPARVNLAMLYYGDKRYAEAEELYKKVVEQEPDQGQVYFSLALLLAEQTKYQEAVHYLEQAIQKDPLNDRYYYNLALTYQQLGLLEKTENTYKRALETISGSLINQYGLAYLLFQQQRFDEAMSETQKLVQMNPANQDYIRLYQAIASKMREKR